MNRLSKIEQLLITQMVRYRIALPKRGRKRSRTASRNPYRPRLEWLETRVTPTATASLSQWQNLGGGWINGDLSPNKAQMLEGDAVPYQTTFSGLATGNSNTYALTIQWEVTNSGLHALDYLTTYNYDDSAPVGTNFVDVTGHALDGVNTSTWTSTQKNTPSSFSIPPDPNINPSPPLTNQNMIFGHTQAAGQNFLLYGGTITSVGVSPYYTLSGSYTGNAYENITVSFNAAVSNPVLVWSGRIATRLDWGPNASAGSISGSPYHMFLNNLTINGAATGVGNQERSLKTGVVLFPTIVYVYKNANPASSGTSFNYTTPNGAFTLTDGYTAIPNPFYLSGSDLVEYPSLAGIGTLSTSNGNPVGTSTNATVILTTDFNNPTATSITEGSLPLGWTVTAIQIVDQNGVSNGSTTLASDGSSGTASLNCTSAVPQTLYVTFTNKFTAASPLLVTTASQVTLGTTAPTISDSAVLSGGYTPTGTIVFTLTGPGGFSYTQADTVSGNGTYTASTTLPTTGTATGTYTWSAHYSGDSKNNPANDEGGAAEQTVVSPAKPTLVTTASPAITLGTTAPTISDSAVLLGGYYETGNIVFTLKLGTTTVATVTDTVSGNGTYTASYTLPTTGTVTGTYTWSASYSGDGNNNPANDQGGAAEQTVVSPASPTLVTTASTAITLGTTAPSISDSAVMSGGYYQTGSIVFTLKLGSTTVYSTSDPVSGNGTYTASYTLPTTGTITGIYTWSASYSGDGNNNSANDQGGAAEQTVVSPANPTLVTTASPASTLGTTAPTISDSALLSGGSYENGSIVFTLKLGSTTVYTTSDPVSGNGTYTASYTLPTTGTVTGTYTWSASYSGDGNNNPANDQGGVAEQTVISPANPTLVTTASPAITLGTTAPTITDSAVLSGGYSETGSIVFTLNLGTTTVATVTDPVSGNGTYGASYTLPTSGTVTGTYTWSAQYSGDTNNNLANDQGGAGEQTVVSPANPTLVTTASPAMTLDTTAPTITDSAVLSGGYSETGSIVFTLNLGTTTVATVTDPVSGNGTYSASYTLPTTGPVTGTYTWSAQYSGDTNNNLANDQGGSAEQTVVSPANPTLVTTASPAITLGTTAPTITDSAVLSGGYSETGSIVFTLNLGTTTVATVTDTVSGNGSYSASYTLPTTGTVTGTYTWSADYSGDTNNNATNDQGGAAEQTVVSPASPTVVTTAGPTVTIGDGNKLTDTADLEGGYFPTGSITFTLYNSNNQVVDTEVVNGINGNGTYTSPGFVPTAAGAYHWSAIYNGDTNNNMGIDSGTSAAEGEAVIAPNLVITKTGNGTVNSTDTVMFTITVSNTGAGSAFNVNLNDPLPDSAHLNWVIQSGDPGSISNGTLTDAIGTLAPGASVTIHVSAVTAPGYSATLINTATATASNNSNVQASATDIVLAPNLTITKTADTTPVNSTDPIGFTITVSNTGAGAAYTGNVSDPLPAPTGVTWSAVTTSGPSGTPAATLTSNTVSDSLGTLAAGATVTFHVTGMTAAGFSGTLNNTATVTSTNNSPGSLSASASITVLDADLTITKTADNSLVNSTDAIGFTITVSNIGASAAYNVTVNDPLPAPTGVTWSSVTTTGPTGTPAATLTSNTVSDNLGTLAAGATVTFHVTGTTAAGFSGTLNNTATVTSTNNSPGSLSATATINVLAPNLTITKTGNGTVNSTDTVNFTITVSNTGAGTAYNVNLNDPLPDSAHLNWVIQSGDPGSISNRTLTDAIGTLAPGASVTIHVSAVTAPGYSATLSNTATATASNNSPGSVSASATDTVLAPNLVITKTGNGTVNSTDTVKFTITVSNTGAGTAYNVNLNDPLPDSAHLNWVIQSSDPGSISNGTLTDAIGNLATGASVTIHVSAATAPGYSAMLSNTATATSPNNSPGSVSASATDIVLAPNLTITKAATSAVIQPGGTVSFTITVSNTGAGTAYNVVMTDPLPDATMLTWTSDAGTIASCTLTDAIGTLASGASLTIHVSALVPMNFFGNIGAANGDPVPTNLFELDGNATVDSPGGHDWNQVYADNTASPKTNTAAAIASSFVTDETTGDDIFTGGSTKDTLPLSGWLFKTAKPQDKDEISHAFAAQYRDPSTNDVILFAGLDRFSNSGNSTAGFWFLVNPISKSTNKTVGSGAPFTGTHADGDILLISNFTIGGSISTIAVYRWTGNDATGHLVDITPLGNPSTFAVVNSGNPGVAWPFKDKAGFSQPQAGEFLEEGVNLSGLGLNGCFSSFLAETRSSQDPSATLSDFVLGSFQTCDVTLSNTASVKAGNFNNGQPITSNTVVVDVNDGMPQLAPSRGSAVLTDSLTAAQLQPIVAQAIAAWSAAGIDQANLSNLNNYAFHIANLPDGELGYEVPGQIWIDPTAAGWGWSLDGIPGRMDLLTVVSHEVGHALGFGDHDSGNDVMTTILEAGVRRLPEAAISTGNLAAAPAAAQGAVLPAAAAENVPVSSVSGTLASEVAFAPGVSNVGVSPIAAAVLDVVDSQHSLPGVLLYLGPQTVPVLATAMPVPAAAMAGRYGDSSSVLVPGQRPPSLRLDSSESNRALPSEEAPDANQADWLAPQANPSETPLEDPATQVGMQSRQRACDACFADGLWMADSAEDSGAALPAAALAFLGCHWGAQRAWTEERTRQRFLN